VSSAHLNQRAQSPLVDAKHPWLGLLSFKQGSGRASKATLEDAIEELEKLLAGVADKPSIQNTNKPSNR
jgi:hypothetical protein